MRGGGGKYSEKYSTSKINKYIGKSNFHGLNGEITAY